MSASTAQPTAAPSEGASSREARPLHRSARRGSPARRRAATVRRNQLIPARSLATASDRRGVPRTARRTRAGGRLVERAHVMQSSEGCLREDAPPGGVAREADQPAHPARVERRRMSRAPRGSSPPAGRLAVSRGASGIAGGADPAGVAARRACSDQKTPPRASTPSSATSSREQAQAAPNTPPPMDRCAHLRRSQSDAPCVNN